MKATGESLKYMVHLPSPVASDRLSALGAEMVGLVGRYDNAFDGTVSSYSEPSGVGVRLGAHDIVLVPCNPDSAQPTDPQTPAHLDEQQLELLARCRGGVLVQERSSELPMLRHVVTAALIGAAFGSESVGFVRNVAAGAVVPLGLIAKQNESMVEFLFGLPIPLLFAGMRALPPADGQGRWCRTVNATALGLPDIALQLDVGADKLSALDVLHDILSYAFQSGARLRAGSKLQLPDGRKAHLRNALATEVVAQQVPPCLVLQYGDQVKKSLWAKLWS